METLEQYLKRKEAIERLENLKTIHPAFYERHPDILRDLDKKIAALKNNKNYEIVNAQYIIPYVFAQTYSFQMIHEHLTLGDVSKKTYTIEDAKQSFNNVIEELNNIDGVEFIDLRNEILERLSYLKKY